MRKLGSPSGEDIRCLFLIIRFIESSAGRRYIHSCNLVLKSSSSSLIKYFLENEVHPSVDVVLRKGIDYQV